MFVVAHPLPVSSACVLSRAVTGWWCASCAGVRVCCVGAQAADMASLILDYINAIMTSQVHRVQGNPPTHVTPLMSPTLVPLLPRPTPSSPRVLAVLWSAAV